MKKVIVACFFVILMLLVPFSGVCHTVDVTKIGNQTEEDEIPKFYITEGQKQALDAFIENNFDEEEKPQAYTLVEGVIQSDLEVNIVELSNSLITLYAYEPIPKEDLYNVTTKDELNQLIHDYWGVTEDGFIENLFNTLLIKIIEYIKDRLGWTYKFYDQVTTLFYEGITLVVDLIQPTILILAILIVDVVNQILEAPKVFYEAILDLFQLNEQEFIDTMTTYIVNFAANVTEIIDLMIDLVEDPVLDAYLTEFQSFVSWLGDEPWKHQIKVEGAATLNGQPLENAVVTCRGESTTTDSSGRYEFYVDPDNTSDDSFPKEKWYGLHKCQITISRDGEQLKQTPKLLSYVFSDGEISWPFVIISAKSKDVSFRNILIEKFDNILVKIYFLLPIFFRNTNRIDILST